MKEKFSVPHEQYEEMKAPTMKGTLIYSVIRGLDPEDHSRTLHELHQELRDMTRLGLKAYKNLLAMSLTTRHWTATDTSSIMARDDWTEDQINLGAQSAQEGGEDIKRTLAAEMIRQRRALRSHSREQQVPGGVGYHHGPQEDH